MAQVINARTLRVARDEKNIILTTDQAAMTKLVQSMDTEIAAIKHETTDLWNLSSEKGKPLIKDFETTYDAYLVEHQRVRQMALLNQNVEAFALANGEAAAIRQ
jgi:methyl-accepting chemotaxis protein